MAHGRGRGGERARAATGRSTIRHQARRRKGLSAKRWSAVRRWLLLFSAVDDGGATRAVWLAAVLDPITMDAHTVTRRRINERCPLHAVAVAEQGGREGTQHRLPRALHQQRAPRPQERHPRARVVQRHHAEVVACVDKGRHMRPHESDQRGEARRPSHTASTHSLLRQTPGFFARRKAEREYTRVCFP